MYDSGLARLRGERRRQKQERCRSCCALIAFLRIQQLGFRRCEEDYWLLQAARCRECSGELLVKKRGCSTG